MKKIILLLFLVTSYYGFSQNWNNIDFINSSKGSIEHSNKDSNDNTLIKTFHSFSNVTLNYNSIDKFNSNNVLLWSKNYSLTGIANAGNFDRKLQLNGSDIYMNDFTTASKGIIIKTPNSSVQSYSAWETLGGTSFSRINDIKIKGNNLYALGSYQASNTGSQSVVFNANSASTYNVPANKTYTFIAKYSISPKSLLWVKIIESGGFVNGKNLEIDNSNNLYISGNYSNNITLYNGGSPTSYNTTNTTTFLAKFDSNGNFNTSFGLKQNINSSNTFAVKIDGVNNNVIYSHDDSLTSYTSNGLLNWTRSVPNTGAIYDIETNSCGDVFVTGDSYSPVSKTPDHQNFFGILLNKNSGNTMWVSNGVNNVNKGKNIFTYSDNSVEFIGDFGSNGINIDTYNSSISTGGFFFAKLNSQNTNSCCNYNVNLGNDIVLCQGQTIPSINIFGQGFDDQNFIINWYINGHLNQTGGLQLMSSVLTGTVMVQITYLGCETLFTDSISVTTIKPINIELQSVYYNCSGNELELCGPTPPQGVTYNYNWGSVTSGLSLSPNQCFVPTQPGNYSLTVTDTNGCSSTTHNFTVLNQLPPLDLGPDINACVGDHINPISFANQGYDNGNYTIIWSHNGNVVQNGGTTLQYMPNSGTITLTVSSPGCPTQIHSINVSIKICCPEKVNIGMILCPGQAPIFHILNQGYDLPGYNITWYFNGNIIQNGGEILQMSMYGNGIINVTVEKDGCKKIVSDQISISCDKDVHPHYGKEKELKQSSINNLNIYPNPASDIINFIFDEDETGKVEIYSLVGKLVFSKDFREINQLEASLSDYQAGIYIARITIGEETITKKIIKK